MPRCISPESIGLTWPCVWSNAASSTLASPDTDASSVLLLTRVTWSLHCVSRLATCSSALMRFPEFDLFTHEGWKKCIFIYTPTLLFIFNFMYICWKSLGDLHSMFTTVERCARMTSHDVLGLGLIAQPDCLVHAAVDCRHMPPTQHIGAWSGICKFRVAAESRFCVAAERHHLFSNLRTRLLVGLNFSFQRTLEL